MSSLSQDRTAWLPCIPLYLCQNCAKPYLFDPLELALSEKQTPEVVEKVENEK